MSNVSKIETPVFVYDNPHLQQGLEKAKEYLGSSWVLHPEYKAEDNPKHRNVGSLK